MTSYDFSAPRLFVTHELRADATIPLEKAQQNYLCNVLRLSDGGTVLVFNGRDGEWTAELTQEAGSGSGRKRSQLIVRSPARQQTVAGDLHYLFAPLKHARLDYMVQKAVEMGASALRPVRTRRTQASRLNLERMEANVVEAAEQCGILALPAVRPLEPLQTVLATWPAERTLVFCDEDAGAGGGSLSGLRRGSPMAVLVGPEGGFDREEREALLGLPCVVRVSLGPRILRADTAAVAALAVVQALAGDWPAP